MRAWFAGCLLLLLPLLARAEVGFEELAQLVESPVELQGSFVQQKYLAALDTSLESSGRFSFRRDESIRWEILQPIQNELVITPAGLSSRQGDDELLRIDASSNPGAALMGEIMFAVLSARWQRLAQYFDLSADIDGERWLASLRPRDAMIGQLFERVELRGAKCLEAIVLYEKGGDRTAIQLQVSSE